MRISVRLAFISRFLRLRPAGRENLSGAFISSLGASLLAFSLLAHSAAAQSRVVLIIRQDPAGFLIPADFSGLSFETGSELADRNRVSGFLFSPANAQLITLFRNAGIHNLRIGGGTVDIPSVGIPGPAEIDNVFGFAKATGDLDLIYSFRLLNGNAGDDAGARGATFLADYIWQRYRPWLAAFAIGNEPDWKAYHAPDPNITDYPSYLARWRDFAAKIRGRVPAASFAGPDTGDYTASTYFRGQSWTERFARDEGKSGRVTAIAQHYYVGAHPGKISAQGAIDAMLSREWVNEKYPWLYQHNLAAVVAARLPYRLTESNDYLGGVTNASNAFASALWALDYMHWWAAHSCAGVNFHNKSWLVTDTVYLDRAGNFQACPKACGIKAFDLGGHGRVQPIGISNTDGLNLTAYAVRSADALCVTIINKEHGNDARAALVTIAPRHFDRGAAAVIFLRASNGQPGATNGITLGGASISNDAPWAGRWTDLAPARNGRFTLTVGPASAAVVRIKRE